MRPFTQRDLGVLEALKLPPAELEADDVTAVGKGALHHLQHAGLSRTPVAVDADRHRGIHRFVDRTMVRAIASLLRRSTLVSWSLRYSAGFSEPPPKKIRRTRALRVSMLGRR
jgi:hypothetical protein